MMIMPSYVCMIKTGLFSDSNSNKNSMQMKKMSPWRFSAYKYGKILKEKHVFFCDTHPGMSFLCARVNGKPNIYVEILSPSTKTVGSFLLMLCLKIV